MLDPPPESHLQIRVLQEDLESEMGLRRRIEHEKQQLQMQIISFSERLTEAESGSESQLEINRKREAEMAKLRKLLEDVHNESEQQIHTLRTKHQTSMMELQEQIERLSRDKEKVVKEKSTMKTEISELYAQIEILQSEKVSIKKVVEKLEITVNEYNIKIGDLNRSVADMTSAKQRLQMEAQDSAKKLNEMKLSLEHAGLDKNKFATQLEELRSLKVTLEGSIAKWQAENADWKKKYENENRLRVEETDALKKKMTLEVNALADSCHTLEQKLKAAENAKAKLTGEVNVLIKDFEHSQVVVKEITAKFQNSERSNADLGTKLKEMTNLYEKADRDSKARANEIVKISNEADRLKMANETLNHDKGVLADEVKSLKTELDALKKRMADMDRDNRKLSHEREELARAYKDADAGKLKALDRVAALEKELSKLKAEFDKKFGGAREDFEVAKRKLVEEINLLTRKLAASESKLKVEVEGIKKKMAITITELEMALDASNKANGQLQMTAMGQAEKIMQLTAAYDDIQKKLGGSVQQYDITVKRLTQIEAELKTVTVNYNNSVKVVKDYETKFAAVNKQVAELSNANQGLTQFKTKVEKDLAAVTRDYNDIARELKLADDRANKASADAGHFESLLREEQTKLVKISNAKAALEKQVHSLSVKIEEIETNSVATSKRTIQKMEIRITELEEMINVEKKSHAVTMTEMQVKTRQIKELVLQSEEDRKNIIILQESLDKLNEKIKMYKRQLEEQEGISNANIMRVKKFQRELECAENRAEEAESTLNQFRSRERVFAVASVRNEKSTDIQETEVVVKKTINKVNIGAASSSSAMESSSSALQTSRDFRAGSTFSRAGSVARAGSVTRAGSTFRSGSVMSSRY